MVRDRYGAYRRRNKRLRDMGFSSYEDYLLSELWAAIRVKVLARDGRKCQACGKPASIAHHSSYSKGTLDGQNLRGIWSLCRPCHKFIEFSGDGAKTPVKKARQRFEMLKRRHGLPAKRPLQDEDRRQKCTSCRRTKTRKMFDGNNKVCRRCEIRVTAKHRQGVN